MEKRISDLERNIGTDMKLLVRYVGPKEVQYKSIEESGFLLIHLCYAAFLEGMQSRCFLPDQIILILAGFITFKNRKIHTINLRLCALLVIISKF